LVISSEGRGVFLFTKDARSITYQEEKRGKIKRLAPRSIRVKRSRKEEGKEASASVGGRKEKTNRDLARVKNIEGRGELPGLSSRERRLHQLTKREKNQKTNLSYDPDQFIEGGDGKTKQASR